jgi:hypothetical protein
MKKGNKIFLVSLSCQKIVNKLNEMPRDKKEGNVLVIHDFSCVALGCLISNLT